MAHHSEWSEVAGRLEHRLHDAPGSDEGSRHGVAGMVLGVLAFFAAVLLPTLEPLILPPAIAALPAPVDDAPVEPARVHIPDAHGPGGSGS